MRPAGGREPQKLRIVTPVGRPARVGQEDDRGFEPLAGMDRQHADAVAFGLHVALDRGVSLLDLGQEQGQRRRLALLVGERQGEKFVDRIRRVRSEPRKQRLPSPVLAEKPGIEGVGRQRPRPLAPVREPPSRRLRALVV